MVAYRDRAYNNGPACTARADRARQQAQIVIN